MRAKETRKPSENVKKIDFFFIFFIVIAVVICSLATIYSTKNIQRNSHLERAKNLELTMSKIGEHLNIAFRSKWNRVRFLATRIERSNPDSVEDLTDTLNDIFVETGAEFHAIDSSGIAYYHDGMQEYWKDHRDISPKAETFLLSPLQFGITNENYMKYIVPLKEPLAIGELRILYTVLTEPLSALSKDFDTSNYGEDCLSFIIDKRGTFIYENGSEDRIADSYNFLAYVKKNFTFHYGESFEHFEDNVKSGVNNTALVTYNDVYYYLSHFNLAMENWVSIMLVPEKNTQAGASNFTQKLLGDIALVFSAAFLLFIVGFLYMWKKTVSRQRLAVEAERRSNEAKTNFLSSMSHDIRTPMNAIIGMTELALHNRKDTPKPVLGQLERIRLSSIHMLMLLNDILDISKIESGKMSLNLSEFSIVEATNTLANLIRPLAKEKKIDLRIHTYDYRQEYLLGDELRISQVIINLATNAIKYTPNGGQVVIDFRQEFPEDKPDKVQLTCIVRDNGIGMSKEYQKIMYESFSRATDSRVNKVAGSGLGLAICRKMVQLMNGTLECESTPGVGTTFTANVLVDKSRLDEEYELRKLHILVVDRDTVSTGALTRVFSRLHVTADIINDSSSLPAVLSKNNTYNLAFVELGVPECGGFSIAQALRKQYGEGFPIVFTDIADMVEYSEQIAALGLGLTMNKPYFYRIVYETILHALERSVPELAPQSLALDETAPAIDVLVAEDNDLNWEILFELLGINGINATRVENGQVCVELLEASEPGQFLAVLMDVRMPVMDGREATRRLRSSTQEWLRTIPIIAMTADAFAEDIQECMDAGMDAHISKPINLGKLLSTLNDVTLKSQKSGV